MRNWFLLGHSGRAVAGEFHPQMRFLTLLWVGLEIRIQALERSGRRAQDWRDSSRIVEPYWFWMLWRLSNLRMVHKRGAYISLPSEGACATSQSSIGGFA